MTDPERDENAMLRALEGFAPPETGDLPQLRLTYNGLPVRMTRVFPSEKERPQ